MSHKPITTKSPGVKITIECEPDDTPIKGNALAIDDVTDAKEERRIARELERGNVWAWCCVRVTVRYRDAIEADATLGACSYRNERDFIKGGYYADMVDECIGQLNEMRAKVCAE